MEALKEYNHILEKLEQTESWTTLPLELRQKLIQVEYSLLQLTQAISPTYASSAVPDDGYRDSFRQTCDLVRHRSLPRYEKLPVPKPI
jgi:hypothetical protein